MKNIICILCLSAVLLISCSKSTPTSTDNTGNTPANTMTVTVDGTNHSWPALGSTTFIPIPFPTTITSISGADASGSPGISITLSNITKDSTYDIGVNGVSMLYQTKDNSGQQVIYSPGNSGTSAGKLTITEYTSTSFKASFNATLPKYSGSASAPATSVITNGSVNATIH